MFEVAERLRNVKISASAAMTRKVRELRAQGVKIVGLSSGEPDFPTPTHAIEAAYKAALAGDTKYPPQDGVKPLKEAIQRKFKRDNNLDYALDEIMVSNGSKQIMYDALQASVNPGDEVIIPAPGWISYADQATLAGARPVPVSCPENNHFKLRAVDLEAAITPRTKGIFLGYPNNPTGAVLSREELAAVADVADRHDLLVYTDEIYARLVYGAHRHTAFSSLPGMRERTVLLGGFSKSYAMTGWRIGYVAAPAELMNGIAKVHQFGIMCAPTVAQYAAIEALRNGEAAVDAMHTEYDRRRQLMTRRLNEIGLRCFEPEGAFYCFPNVTDATGLDDEDFAQALLADERVAVVPGRAFGPSGMGHVRACYATAYEEIVEAMDRMERFVARHRA